MDSTTKEGYFFKDSNIILKYSILGNCFGFKKHVYRQVGEY